MDHIQEKLCFSESLLEAAFLDIPTTSDASTSTGNSLATDTTLGVASTTITNLGRKGLLFDGQTYFQIDAN